MTRFSIRVNIGDNNVTRHFEFVHKDYNIKKEKAEKEFDKAVKELNHIYKDYGRFATSYGVINLFDKYGFELSIR